MENQPKPQKKKERLIRMAESEYRRLKRREGQFNKAKLYIQEAWRIMGQTRDKNAGKNL